MANNTESSKRACASIYFRFSSLLGLVHDKCTHLSSDFIKFGR